MACQTRHAISPNGRYMISYGGMLTAMFACFVVLNSLAQDQTGAELQIGMNSLTDALQNGGWASDSADRSAVTSPRVFAHSPDYVMPLSDVIDADDLDTGLGEDVGDSELIDNESQDYQRFLNELERMSPIEKVRSIEGDVSFDCFEKLSDGGLPLPPSLWEAANNLRPYFEQADIEIELTVWAATPSQSAWTRAVRQAAAMCDAIAVRLELSAEGTARFRAVSRPWLYSNLERPTVSLTVRRLRSE